MKKLFTLLLAALMVVASSCGGEPTTTSDTTVADSTETTLAASDTTVGESQNTESKADEPKKSEAKSTYECKLDCGVTVTVGAKADEALKAVEDKLGKHTDFMEAPSCVHPGKDKVYTFEGFTLTSSPDAAGEEFISELSFSSDTVGFESGVMIGSSADDVTAAFGDKFAESFGVRKYTLDNITITVTFDGDAVSAISVSSAF